MTLDVTITPLSEVQHSAAIRINQEELQPLFDEAYQRFRPKAQVRGFRKGKVPMSMIRQLYGEAIEHEALDDIADQFYRRAMEEKNIRPLGKPSMTEMDFRRGEYFTFTITYEIRPEIKLADVRGIPIEKVVHTVTDHEVDDEILQIRRANSTQSPAERVTDSEYIVTGTVQELDPSGAPLIGKKSSEMKFQLYDTSLAAEIREALQGAEVGGTYTVVLPPRDEKQAEPLRIAITATAVEKVALPEFDGALVGKVTGGSVTDPAAFRESLRTDLQKFWDDQSESRVRNALADEVIRRHDFSVPDVLIDNFLDAFVDDVRGRSRDKSLPPGFDEKKFREENRPAAVWQARWLLLKERIAEAEQIAVDDAELEAAAAADAPRMGVPADKLLTYYRGSTAVRERLLSEKISTFLRSHATITEREAAPEQPHIHPA